MRRRQFLELSAASVLAAPFVRLLHGSARGATSTGTAERFLVLFSPNGTIPHRLGVSGTGTSYGFDPGSILEPLSGLESELQVIGGMNFNVGDNHEGGMRNMLTCGGDISIDQVIADRIGTSSRFKSLELSALTSAWGGSTQTRMCYRGGTFVTPDDDPRNAWGRLFGDLGDETLISRRQSVIDIASEELSTLHARLGTEQRVRLDAHLDGLRSVEQSLFGGGSCDDPVPPSIVNPQDNDAFPAVVEAQLDLAVQALLCGATNVATVQLSHTVSPVVCTWLGASEAHHELSHADDGNTAGVQSFVDCERWYAEQFRYLVEQMQAAAHPETGAPLIDSTVVLWVKELGDSRLHICDEVPWILAGTGNGFFGTGRHVDVGTTHDGVLTSVANAFGLELSSFGTGTAGPVEALR